MEYWLLMGGAALSLVGGLFHGVAGHKIYMGNINASNLESIAKSLSLVSWHMFTIMLIVGAGTLVCIAYEPTMALMAYPIILVNAGGALMFLAFGLGGHGQLLRLPGMYLMSGTAILAWLGIG
ncbi:hypothetical protein [Luminiphilus sp. nBUS_07]|uniref:hypothetical protein n=1 Tax=Luminiphilus sp. nBUS_07 TaxID=3395314 RepID=UPI003EBBFC2A